MRVLVIGPRKGLCEALAEERIHYVVWTDASRPLRSAERVHVAPIAVGKSAARREAETLAAHGPFTHVNVVPAGLDDATRAAALELNRIVIRALRIQWGMTHLEMDRAFAFPQAPKAHAAAVVLHPGPGTVAAIRGLADVRRRPEVVEARIRVRSGDRVKPRAGVSENVGHVVLCAPTREQLLEAWEEVDARLRVELA